MDNQCAYLQVWMLDTFEIYAVYIVKKKYCSSYSSPLG